MVGSTGQPFSSIMGKVDLESLAMATQFLKTVLYRRQCLHRLESIPGEYAIWGFVRDFYPESEAVTDPDSLHLLLPGIQDSDSARENRVS